METSELETAYRAVLDLAASGPGSRPDPADGTGPAAGGAEEAWRVEDVLAHLVLNDRLLARAVRSVRTRWASTSSGLQTSPSPAPGNPGPGPAPTARTARSRTDR